MVFRHPLHHMYVCIMTTAVEPSNASLGACQIGSGVFGEWFWWLYMVVRFLFNLYLRQCFYNYRRFHYMPS